MVQMVQVLPFPCSATARLHALASFASGCHCLVSATDGPGMFAAAGASRLPVPQQGRATHQAPHSHPKPPSPQHHGLQSCGTRLLLLPVAQPLK
jgi:hypothetical protein